MITKFNIFETSQSMIQKNSYKEKERISNRLSNFFSYMDNGKVITHGTYKSENGYILVSGTKPCNLYFSINMEEIFDLIIYWLDKENLLRLFKYQKRAKSIQSNHQYTITIPNEHINTFLDSIDRLRTSEDIDEIRDKLLIKIQSDKYNL